MTPTRSVIKLPNPRLCLTGAGTRAASASGGARMAHFEALCKGVPVSSSSSTVVNTVEVPHFSMKEDPSFWMDHNVQVLIRIRPLNGMEKSVSGYARCLKQESEQCITWIGQPETRFTFDHVACETLDQETLFRTVGLPMVENCLRGYNSCIFAYGQTGSGKTYTMLGNVNNLGDKPSPDCGMTSRIFEYLFTRIRAEEESRDGRLSYSCKCSFLEIYNEQITDLLDPSSTNLLLREDIKTGVYVENLSESEVHSVGDILKLLSQGSSNRKVAATNMNRESSRSHSVFTCVIESRWEKHSTTNIRFARLNLVDLAGSERQKTSGAEGERLKEAANINKSLSTLGYVIMVLVDAAHAKTKHVPYRDSRLTFLLQDSLGGNSKTMIIANVSPSICCAAETLNTLKFAQRAKLIQNNAVVNEDPPEDVTALQYQIHLLKEELLLLKPKKVSRSLTFHTTFVEDTRQEHNTPSKIKVLAMGYQNTGVSSNSASNVESPSLKEQLHNAVQPENGDINETLIKRTHEVVDLQLELDILKIMLKEERSFRIDLENRALCLTRDIELAEGKVSQLTKRYEDMNKELSEAKSLSEVLKSQHLVSLREMEDLRNSSNHYVDLLRKQEHEISLLKEKASDKKLSCPSSDKLSTIEESISQINPKKTHDSLEKMKRPNTRYQSGLASHASNENEIDEVHRQDEAKIAEMIVCLQEQLGVLQHQVQWSDQQETETKGRLMLLQTELKELQENFELVTRNNKSLVEKLDEKNKQLKALSEEWKSVTTEIEVVLAGGQEALEDASNHVGAISGSLPQKRKWISEELSRMTRSIFEKEFMIKKLTNYLEDATTRKSDMESMIRSLRGAALAITEEHQQDCSEKEKEIINLTSQLSEKTLIIAELENKMKRDDEQLRNASKCATVGFIVVSRLSEINFDYLNSLKHKDIQLMESIGINMQKGILPYNQVEEEKQTCSLRTEIEVALLQLSELKKHISYLEQKLNEAEEIKVPEAKEILADLKDGISTLQSWLKDRDDVLGYFEEQFLPDLSAKEFEFLVLASELEQMAVEKFRLQKEKIGFANALEKLKEDVVFQSVDAEFKKWILLDKEVEVTHLENEIEAAKTELNVIISEMKKANKAFEQDLILLNDATCSNGAFKKELQEVTEANMRLSSEIIKLKFEYEKSLEDMQVSFNVKGKRLEEARQCIQILEQEIAAKDKEICQQKAHISERYPHSEAQACEYKQKIKAIQPEGPTSHIRNSPIFKLQKNDSRMRDSDSPLKCTGLELVNLEPERRDKQTTGRPHIIELENLATNEIFMLSSRLATAKNIAHDVSRDLLELKSTISAYVSTLDEHQVIK